MSNHGLRQREWTGWVEKLGPDTCLQLRDIIDQCYRQLAASFSRVYSPTHEVSGNFANAIFSLDISCQRLILVVHQGINDLDACTKLEMDLRVAIGYADFSKEVNLDYFWS